MNFSFITLPIEYILKLIGLDINIKYVIIGIVLCCLLSLLVYVKTMMI